MGLGVQRVPALHTFWALEKIASLEIEIHVIHSTNANSPLTNKIANNREVGSALAEIT